MKKAAVLVLAVMLAVTLSGAAFADGSGFSLRGGIRFGMTPEEIIGIEKSNGFNNTLTRSGDLLYTTKDSLQLYYNDNTGYLGILPIFRYEYDFDPVSVKMFQFYYVFDVENAYEYLLQPLTEKYGKPDPSVSIVSLKHSEYGTRDKESRWLIDDGENRVLVDLWENSPKSCMLAYYLVPSDSRPDEKESLDFGL